MMNVVPSCRLIGKNFRVAIVLLESKAQFLFLTFTKKTHDHQFADIYFKKGKMCLIPGPRT